MGMQDVDTRRPMGGMGSRVDGWRARERSACSWRLSGEPAFGVEEDEFPLASAGESIGGIGRPCDSAGPVDVL